MKLAEHCSSLGYSPSVLQLALRHPSAAGGKPGGLHFIELTVRVFLGEPYGDGERMDRSAFVWVACPMDLGVGGMKK